MMMIMMMMMIMIIIIIIITVKVSGYLPLNTHIIYSSFILLYHLYLTLYKYLPTSTIKIPLLI